MLEVKYRVVSLGEEKFIIYYCFNYLSIFIYNSIFVSLLFLPRMQGSKLSARIKELEEEVGFQFC